MIYMLENVQKEYFEKISIFKKKLKISYLTKIKVFLSNIR